MFFSFCSQACQKTSFETVLLYTIFTNLNSKTLTFCWRLLRIFSERYRTSLVYRLDYLKRALLTKI